MQALPGTQAKVKQKLQRLNTQLQPLEDEKRHIDRRANKCVLAELSEI